MYGLDLFSGIGGITLALRDWVTPIAYCEIDRYAQGVLLSRMSEGQLPMAPIWDDVATLRAEHLPIKPDIIYGGFPCQDISVAGRGIGLEGKRSGLFFEIDRLVGEIRPRFVFLENVPAINLRGQEQVVSTLTELGYDCRWTVVSAAEVGANHLRRRWFCLAFNTDSYNEHQIGTSPKQQQITTTERGSSEQVADSNLTGLPKQTQPGLSIFSKSARTSSRCESGRGDSEGRAHWSVEPNVGRVANGVQSRVDRLKGLGNAVVPLQVKTAFQRLLIIAESQS